MPNSPILAHKDSKVGNSKWIKTDATLYSNGKLMISCYTRCHHLTEGLHGRVYVVCVDAKGNAIWVTELDKCTTRGSIGDPFTPSAGTNNFNHDVPPAVAKATKTLDIYQGTKDLNKAYEKMIENIKKFLKDVKDIGLKGLLPKVGMQG
jgi:hypothetical protein